MPAQKPIDLVRVKDPATGHHFTTTRAFAQTKGFEVLPDRTATSRDGRPAAAKYATTPPKTKAAPAAEDTPAAPATPEAKKEATK